MNLADRLFEIPMFMSTYIIAHLYTSVLILIILQGLTGYKNWHISVLTLIKWLIIIYAIITIICWLLVYFFSGTGEYAFLDRATGPYAWAYWIMLFFNCVFPFILFYKPLGKNIYFVFLVSILMNVGFFMERFVIIITSIHRDYLP